MSASVMCSVKRHPFRNCLTTLWLKPSWNLTRVCVCFSRRHQMALWIYNPWQILVPLSPSLSHAYTQNHSDFVMYKEGNQKAFSCILQREIKICSHLSVFVCVRVRVWSCVFTPMFLFLIYHLISVFYLFSHLLNIAVLVAQFCNYSV